MNVSLRHVACAAMMLYAAGNALAHEPAVAPAPATAVTLSGALERSLILRVDELKNSASGMLVELSMPGGKGTPPGTVTRVRGVRLRELIDQARVVTRDHNTVKKLAIIAGASDGYKVVFSWGELFNSELGDGVLVIVERDGKPLTAAEGPLALVSARDTRPGPRHVKWLQSIEVRQIVD